MKTVDNSEIFRHCENVHSQLFHCLNKSVGNSNLNNVNEYYPYQKVLKFSTGLLLILIIKVTELQCFFPDMFHAYKILYLRDDRKVDITGFKYINVFQLFRLR